MRATTAVNTTLMRVFSQLSVNDFLMSCLKGGEVENAQHRLSDRATAARLGSWLGHDQPTALRCGSVRFTKFVSRFSSVAIVSLRLARRAANVLASIG